MKRKKKNRENSVNFRFRCDSHIADENDKPIFSG